MKIQHVTAAAFALAALTATGVRAAPSTGSQVPNVQAASDPKEQRPDVEGEFKAAPPGMFSTAAAPAPVDEPVAAVEPATAPVDNTAATTRCGLTVVSTSPNAVGDPCATTQDVIASLNLSDEQIAYIDAHSSIDEGSALAH